MREKGMELCRSNRRAFIRDSFAVAVTAALLEPDSVLVGRAYWAGLLDWMRGTLLANGTIAEGHLEHFHVTDDPTEVIEIIRTHRAAGGER